MSVPTVVKQRKAGKPPSPGDHEAELGKVGQKLLCVAMEANGPLERRSLRCVAKVKRVNGCGRFQQVSGQARHGWLCVRVAQLGKLETLM